MVVSFLAYYGSLVLAGILFVRLPLAGRGPLAVVAVGHVLVIATVWATMWFARRDAHENWHYQYGLLLAPNLLGYVAYPLLYLRGRAHRD